MSRGIPRLLCTLCGAVEGGCDCWELCSCGWTARKGQMCKNPATKKCRSKVRYGKYNRKSKGYE